MMGTYLIWRLGMAAAVTLGFCILLAFCRAGKTLMAAGRQRMEADRR